MRADELMRADMDAANLIGHVTLYWRWISKNIRILFELYSNYARIYA